MTPKIISTPFSPHLPISTVDLTRYAPHPFDIWYTCSPETPPPDAAPICGIGGIFICWQRCVSSPPHRFIVSN